MWPNSRRMESEERGIQLNGNFGKRVFFIVSTPLNARPRGRNSKMYQIQKRYKGRWRIGDFQSCFRVPCVPTNNLHGWINKQWTHHWPLKRYIHCIQCSNSIWIVLLNEQVEFVMRRARRSTDSRPMTFLFINETCLHVRHGLVISAPVEFVCWDMRYPEATLKVAIPPPSLIPFFWPGKFSTVLR